MMNDEKQTPLLSADHPPKSKDSSTKQEPVDTSTKWDPTDQVRTMLVSALYGPLGSSSPSACHLLQTLLKELDGSTPGMRESLSTTAMVGLKAVVNQAQKSAPQVTASKTSQGLADVDMENYNTPGDPLANSQVPSIEDDDDTNNQGSSCQQEVMKDKIAALPSDEINGVVPQGSADVDMENYNTTGDSLANSQVPSIEDDDETANKGSSCQQEVMKNESAALPSNEINAGVPDQDSDSFYLRNVSMAAKNRVHSFVLDLVNTISSQLDTSSHLNQPELNTSESVEAGLGPVNEDSSGYTKVLMQSVKGKDSSESTAMSPAKKSAPQVNASKASQGLADVDMENYNTTGDSLENSQVPSIEDDDETNNKDSSCQQEVMKDKSAALPSNESNAGVPGQDSDSFYLRNVSMAANNRVHSFVLDVVNTTSSQLDTSSHLNQPEVTTSDYAGLGPVNEDSSSYTKVLMQSIKGKDSSESTAMSSGNKRKRKRSVPESLDASEKESDEPLQKSQCLIMETNLHQTDEPLPKVPWLAVEKTDSSTAKVTIEQMHPPGEPTDSWTSTGKGISLEAEGKTRKRKRRAPEILDTTEKECDEPLRKSRCLVAETNDKFPQAEEPDSHKNVARVKVENSANPEALQYAHLCLRNAYHALLSAGILEHRAAVMAPENVTIQPQAEIRSQVKPYKQKRRRRRRN